MNRVESAVSQLLDGTDLILVDVGAAYGLPAHLAVLTKLATVCYFEPDEKAAREVEDDLRQRGLTKSHVFPVALAGGDGPRTLYVTNAPTGSSLLKPGSEAGQEGTPHNYFYPMREVTVQTRALAGVLKDAGLPRVDAIKLDVQGAEFEVLTGLGAGLVRHTLAVELEIGFPGSYIDQPGFGELDRLMCGSGFRLFDLRTSRHDRHYKGDFDYYRRAVFHLPNSSTSLTKRISEADGIYFRNPEQVLSGRDATAVRRLAVLMGVYGFFADALELVSRASEIGILTPQQDCSCREAILAWHGATRDVIFDSLWFARLAAFAKRASRALQRRALGRAFYRWID